MGRKSRGMAAAVVASILTFVCLVLAAVAVGYSWYIFNNPIRDSKTRIGHWYIKQSFGEEGTGVETTFNFLEVKDREFDIMRAAAVAALVFCAFGMFGYLFCCIRRKSGPAIAAGIFMIIAMICSVVAVAVGAEWLRQKRAAYSSQSTDMYRRAFAAFFDALEYDGGFYCACVNIGLCLIAAICWFVAGAKAKKTVPIDDY